MTDLPTYAEMMAVGDKRADAEREAEESDGFVAEEWSEDGDVWGCLGHVDREKFIAQVRRRYEDDGSATYLDGVTVDQVEHRYVLVDPDENAEYLYRWSVVTAVETTPPIPGHVRLRAVTADDHGAEPVTMLDL
jgi:hypothetical protein